MSIITKIKIVKKNPRELIYWFVRKTYIGWLLPDEMAIRIMYYFKMNTHLRLSPCPITFNEKIQWLKLYDRNPLYTQLVDKYEVRKYIKDKIGEEYLIPIYGIYNSFDEINFNDLPQQFVLKCTHDAGSIIICQNKDIFNKKEAKKKLTKRLKYNYFYNSREWPYKDVPPRILCEKLMQNDSGVELLDYKIMCFNGEPKCTFVCLNRFSEEGLNVDFYDLSWQMMPLERHYSSSKVPIPCPKNWGKMLEFSRILSRNIPFVRVDFYEINDHLYAGELTFHPGSGWEEFTPTSWDETLGSWINISSV